jgi:hypothetical protein
MPIDDLPFDSAQGEERLHAERRRGTKSKIENLCPIQAGIENVKGDFSCKRTKRTFHGVRF